MSSSTTPPWAKDLPDDLRYLVPAATRLAEIPDERLASSREPADLVTQAVRSKFSGLSIADARSGIAGDRDALWTWLDGHTVARRLDLKGLYVVFGALHYAQATL